jgi:hypothetical protein
MAAQLTGTQYKKISPKRAVCAKFLPVNGVKMPYMLMPKALVDRITRIATSIPIARKNVLRRLIVLICCPSLDYKPALKVV